MWSGQLEVIEPSNQHAEEDDETGHYRTKSRLHTEAEYKLEVCRNSCILAREPIPAQSQGYSFVSQCLPCVQNDNDC